MNIPEHVAMVSLTQSPHPPSPGPHWGVPNHDQHLAESVAYLGRALAHDLNNLLMAIHGHCTLLAQAEHPAEGVAERLGEILLASDQALLLARQMQAGPGAGPGDPSLLDLNQLLQARRALVLCLLRDQQELILDLAPLPCPVRVGPGQVERVLVNLTVNAREAMGPTGTLRVSTQRLEVAPDSDLALNLAPGEYVGWMVQDTGRGLEEDFRLRLLHHPASVPPGPGRGLGLAIVQALVQEWGGHIEIDSEPGQGTALRLYLPLAEAAKESPVMMPTATAMDRETILLVEDENQVRAIFKRMLADQGYLVIEADNAGDAMDLAKERAQPIHLLVTDLALPRMSGFELADRVLQFHPETKVLMLSGYSEGALPGQKGRSLQHPFLQKPCTPENFLRKVREVLAG